MAQNELLSDELQLRVERLIKAKIATYRQVGGGYTPALRLLCHTDKTSFFVKVGATPAIGNGATVGGACARSAATSISYGGTSKAVKQ